MTKDGELLPEIRKRIALGWTAFGKVGTIMKSRKASMNCEDKEEEDSRRVHSTSNDIWLRDMGAEQRYDR